MLAPVQGGWMGGGFELALGCDMIVATRSATFRFPEAGLGVLTLQGGVMQLAEHSAFGGSGRAYGGCRRRSRMGAITRDCSSCRRQATRWLGFVGPEAFRAVARGRDGSGLFERSVHFSVVLLPITFVQLLSRRI
jgi:hypothetical protein